VVDAQNERSAGIPSRLLPENQWPMMRRAWYRGWRLSGRWLSVANERGDVTKITPCHNQFSFLQVQVLFSAKYFCRFCVQLLSAVLQ
jgi:hypothetical protein